MHEELYLDPKSKLKYLLFAVGVLLLPFSLFEFSLKDGAAYFAFSFDLPLFAASVLFILIFFEKLFKTAARLTFPFFALLICEFMRFGTVSLFERKLPFNIFIVSATIMGLSFIYTFLLYFITAGKMRSKVPILLFSLLLYTLAAVSLALRWIPFFAYENTTDGAHFFSISYLAAFALLNSAGFFIALSLKDDRVLKEKKERRERKKAEKQKGRFD